MENARDIIILPIITERSMQGLENKKYTFKVKKTANKIEIKQAVEQIFGVKVQNVNTISVRGKEKRLGPGRPSGKTPAYKKAVVKLTDDSKSIEFFDSLM